MSKPSTFIFITVVFLLAEYFEISIFYLIATAYFTVVYLKTGRKSVLGMVISSLIVFISLLAIDYTSVVKLKVYFGIAAATSFGSLFILFVFADDLEVKLEQMKSMIRQKENADN